MILQRHLLMHAMGPNVAGVIGTAVVAGDVHGSVRYRLIINK